MNPFPYQSMLRRALLAMAVLSLGYTVYVAIVILSAAPELRVQYIPDDAYYYFTLARNFSELRQWTFDSGISLTTGFHPLHAYLLAFVYGTLHPGPEDFVRIGVLSSALLFIPVWFMGFVFAKHSKSIPIILLFVLFASSRNTLLNSISAVEWAWMVLFPSVYCYLFLRADEEKRQGVPALVFICGLCGIWARTDFLFLPVAFVVAAVVERVLARDSTRLRNATIGLAGAAVGYASYLMHNYLLTGVFLQSSAKMKLLWIEVYGPAIGPFVRQVGYLFGPDNWMTAVLGLGVVVAGIVSGVRVFYSRRLSRRQAERPQDDQHLAAKRMVWVGCLFAVAGYHVFYAWNPAGMQSWYTGNIVVPLFLLISLPLFGVGSSQRVSAGISAALIALVIGQAVNSRTFFSKPQWPHQQFMYEGGRFLRDTAGDERVGSWNSGIIGYYQGGQVINLDGLVNNDIYSHAATNNLPSYIDEKSIRYLMDFERMLSDEGRRRRGGYDDVEFLDRIETIKVFDKRTTGWKQLTFYRIGDRRDQ